MSDLPAVLMILRILAQLGKMFSDIGNIDTEGKTEEELIAEVDAGLGRVEKTMTRMDEASPPV